MRTLNLSLIFILCCTALVSCINDIVESYPKFSFEKRVDVVNVSSETTEYILKGTIKLDRKTIYPVDEYYAEKAIYTVPKLTTAVHGVHYFHPEMGSELNPGVDTERPYNYVYLHFRGSRETSTKFALFPENIKEEVQIVFTIISYSPYIDTLTIRLIPIR